MTTPYTTGQISLVNGSAMVTGVGTGWATSLIKGGIVFVEADGGNSLPLLPDDSATANLHPITDTQMTAAIAWTGPTGTYDYALIRDTAYLQQLTANSQALANYTQRLNSTALSAVAGITPVAETLLLFTGEDTATTIALSGLINGADYDVQVDNLAGRAAYDSRPANFRVLVSDIGDGRSAIYSKNSNTAADWSAPAYITGPAGPDGVNPRGNYDPATSYAADDLAYSGGSTWIAKTATTGNAPPTLPTTENTQWRIFARAGSAGVNPRGAYTAGTTYAALDVVLDNGSSWIAKTTTTGNTPPVLPTTENTYWILLAAKGTDGTGTGDVVGPASAVNNQFALMSGTSGKVIKAGPVIGGAASLNVGTTAGTVAAGDDPRFSQGGGSDPLLALALSEVTANYVATRQVFADGFKSLGFVNTGGATNLDTSEAGYLKPSGGGGTTKGSAATSGSTAAPGSGFLIVDRSYAVDNNVLIAKIGIYSTTAGSGSFKIMNEDSTTQYDILYTQSFTHSGGGWQDFTLTTQFQTPTTGTLRIGTRFASGGPTGSTVANGARSYVNSDPGVQNNLSGFTADNAGVFSSRYIFGVAGANLTVSSEIIPRPYIPSAISGALRVVAVDAVTLNTDVMLDVRRSQSASWVTSALELDFADGGVSVLRFGSVSMAGQPSEGNVQWRIRTANGKMVKFDGVAMEFKP